MAAERVRVGILGASGYTGAELLRLLGDHPRAQIRTLTAERQAGKPVAEVWPQLGPYKLPDLVKIGELDAHGLDVVFCCLPHGTTQAVIRDLPRGPRIIDLSADFRLRDLDAYAATYGHEHQASGLQEEAVYGLSEHYRDAIRQTRLVANPGCFTTTAELPLIPLLRRRLIRQDGIIIDAKSGVSGAGRETRLGSLFTEVAEGIHAYGVATHRHTPEIEQCLADFAGGPIRVTFTPHLVPMSRGLLATIYVADGRRHRRADAARNAGRGLCRRALRPRPAVQDDAGHPAHARQQSLPDRRPSEPHRGRGHPGRGLGQPGQGRLRGRRCRT